MTAMIANDFLVCPECETPAIQASSATNDLPCWTEDDADVWCPGCGCLLRVFLTGDCQGSEWYEARVAEYSGRDWRREIESVLGFDSMSISLTPEHLASLIEDAEGGAGWSESEVVTLWREGEFFLGVFGSDGFRSDAIAFRASTDLAQIAVQAIAVTWGTEAMDRVGSGRWLHQLVCGVDRSQFQCPAECVLLCTSHRKSQLSLDSTAVYCS